MPNVPLSPRHKVVLWIVTIICAATLAIGVWLLLRATAQTQAHSLQAKKAELVQLHAARQILNHARVPYGWPAGTYISEAALNRTLDLYEGVKLVSDELPGFTLVIESISARTTPGATRIGLRIAASQDKATDVVVRLKATAALSLRSVARPKEGESEATAKLGISLLELKPEMSWKTVSAYRNGILERIVSGQAMESISESLEIDLPLNLPVPAPIHVEEKREVDIGDAKADLIYSSNPISLDTTLTIIPPFSDGTGVWFLEGSEFDLQLPEADTLPDDVKELDDRISKLGSEIGGKLTTVAKPSHDTLIWLHHSSLSRPFDKYNNLPQEDREVIARLENIRGRVLDATAIDEKVGFIVTLKEGARAAGKLGRADIQWNPSAGLIARIPIEAHAAATVRTEVKTVVGGGLTFDSPLEGNAKAVIEASLGLKVIQSQGHSALMVGPVFSCTHTPITVQTNDDLLKLGVEIYLPLVSSPSAGEVVISSEPTYSHRTIAKADSPYKEVSNGITYVAQRWNNLSSTIVEGGYLVGANLDVSLTSKAPNSGTTSPDFSQEWRAATVPVCPPDRQAKILFAGQDFGENNVLVKALSSAAKTLENQKRMVVVSFDIAKTAVKDPKELPSVLKDGYDVVEDEVKRPIKEAKRVLGKIGIKL